MLAVDRVVRQVLQVGEHVGVVLEDIGVDRRDEVARDQPRRRAPAASAACPRASSADQGAQGAPDHRGLIMRTLEKVEGMSLAALSGNPVHTTLWDLRNEAEMGHIKLSREADLVVVCPATADLLARMACGIADAVAHLHARGLSHGDLYAHNILWDGDSGAATLTDFGAASPLPTGTHGDAWRRIETRAFGLLFEELLDHCAPHAAPARLRELATACTQSHVAARPAMAEVSAALMQYTTSEKA